MRAFAIDQFGETGSVRDVPQPTPQEGQVRVRVEAASVNPVDAVFMTGAYKDMLPHHLPLVPGMDLGGVVDAVGDGVTGLQVGDRVFGIHGKMSVGEGTLAEYVIATPGTLARRPDGIDAAFGAGLGLAGASALQMVEVAGVESGDPVLVIGAAGGIGSIAVQLLAAAGAMPIAVTRAANHDYVRSLGAVAALDYATDDVFEKVRAVHPGGIAAIFDMAGDKESINHLAELVRSGGHVVSMAGAADAEALAGRGVIATNVMTQGTSDKFERLAEQVQEGRLKQPEIRKFRLADAAEALAEIRSGHTRGKLVVVP